MLIAAAVCPHPPLLIPAATGASRTGHEELDRLRMACRQAVADLLAAHPDLVVVAGGAGRTAEYPPDAPGRLHDFGVPFAVGAANPDVSALPLSLTVGKWLLSEHQVPRTAWWGVASDARPAECLQLGEKLAALAPRVALLALGDGPARRAQAPPGAADPAADRYDEQVAGALAAAEPGALAALDPRQDGPLVVAGRAAWQVLAGSAAEDRFAAELHYAGAPFEVSYLVASWRRAH